MNLGNLLNAAAFRISPVTVAGETIYVKEPTGPQMAAFSKANAEGQTALATADLFRACITTADGDEALTQEQADQLASGSTRISGKLIQAITGTLVEDAKNG
jgi:hypothetical protein